MIAKSALIFSLLALLILVSYPELHTMIHTSKNDTNLVPFNPMCEYCQTISSHIAVPCFNASDTIYSNMTCRIYYEVCVTEKCINTTNCTSCINIQFSGLQFTISRQAYTMILLVLSTYLFLTMKWNREEQVVVPAA